MTLDDIEDKETLRRAAKLLEAENQRLAQEIAKLAKELHALKGGDPQQLMLQLAGLEQQLANLQKKVFGDSSEKRKKVASEKKSEPQRGHGPRPQLALAIVEQVHVADEADKKCVACGGDLREWNGQFEESEEIDVIERRFVIKKHKRQKYRCQCGQCIETAPGPTKLFEGARYSPNVAVTVAIEKYVDHMPLERQVRTMAREGLEIDSQTLWDQLNALARVLEPAHARLHTYVLSQPVIGADETFWRLMGAKGKRDGGDGKRWQTWAVVASNAVSYRILDSRSTEAAEQVLGGYAGTVLSDGYTAYEALQKRGGRFKLAHCWAHVRRKFSSANSTQSKTRQKRALQKNAFDYVKNARSPSSTASTRGRCRRKCFHKAVSAKRSRTWAASGTASASSSTTPTSRSTTMEPSAPCVASSSDEKTTTALAPVAEPKSPRSSTA
jgi:transposase